MKKRWALIILLFAGIVASLLLLRIPQQRITTLGIDSFEHHRALFADHTFSQDIVTQGAVTEIGAILVDFFRAEQLVDVNIRIHDTKTDTTLATTTIPAERIADDSFASAQLDTPISNPGQSLQITFSAPQATNQNPIGLRFHPDQQGINYARYENQQQENGTFAVQITEKVPLWRYLYTNLTQHPEKTKRAGFSLLIATSLAALASRLGFHRLTPRQTRIIEYGAIILLAILALTTRFHIINQLGGVSGGDPYNYLFITDSLTKFQNPFVGVKRLPGYPLLLAPSYLLPQIDDAYAMRTISTLSAGGSLIMLFLLARSLRLPWAVQFLAPTLLAWQKDFLWVSTRPEPYTFYTFLLLTSLVLWFNQTRRWQQITFGLVLGYAAMTRQEGFVLALLLGIASVIRELYRLRSTTNKTNSWLSSAKQLAWSYLPALALVLPFFLHNAITFGNPIYTPYFKGERLQIVDSYHAFQDALRATWGVVGSMFKTSWDQLERVGFGDGRFRLGIIGLLFWAVLWRFLPNTHRRPVYTSISLLAITLAILQSWIYIIAPLSFNYIHYLFPVTAGIIIIAGLPFLYYTKLPGILVGLILVSQILIATWFHPFPKHYQQSYPLLVLLIVTAFIAPLFHRQQSKLPSVALFSVLLPITIVPALFAFPLFDRLNTAIDDQNAHAALDSVVYRAVQDVRSMPGPHGFDQAYLPARLYFTDHAHYYTPEDSTPQRDQKWLQENNIKTLVVINSSNAFQNLPDPWKHVQTHKSAGKDEFIFHSYIYRRP